MTFWVYIDRDTSRARVHRGDCPFCRGGRGVRGSRLGSGSRWQGPFRTAELALARAIETDSKDVDLCFHCVTQGRI